MAVDLVHRLATDNSPQVKKILDNVIFLLIPSLNPDGQIMVTDWFNRNLGTPFENSPIPYLYHPYVGHDNNRDMYMFTQKESQLTAKLLWADWYPSVWLDEHQMGSNGARIFVMPATDPINPNVHPLIYRWNGILGQSQAAALEAAGKEGIIYNSTYTNFWQGAMAWSGWWHNQIGLLTEVASARVAAPMDQLRAMPGRSPAPAPAPAAADESGRGGRGSALGGPTSPLPAPTDTNPRTEYPRPWLGGHWTLADIVDYELIATMALLDTVADRREALLQQIYAVNRETIEMGQKGDPAAILIPVETQHDPGEAVHLVERLQMAGVEVYRSGAAFNADARSYAAGTFVIPMDQVFARYAKDMLEKQTYPEVRRSPSSAPEPPYDVTAWSLGMLLGVDHVVVGKPIGAEARLQKLTGVPSLEGRVSGTGLATCSTIAGPTARRRSIVLLKDGAARVVRRGVSSDDARGRRPGWPMFRANRRRRRLRRLACRSRRPRGQLRPARCRCMRRVSGCISRGRVATWTKDGRGGCSSSTASHPRRFTTSEVRAGKLRERFDAIILPDQAARAIVDGLSRARPSGRSTGAASVKRAS